MSQKESEWEKTIKEIADELWELLPPDFFYKNVDRKTMYNWIKTHLENVLSNREKEIAEEVKKLIGFGKNGKDKVWVGNGNDCLYVERKAVLSLLKH